MPSSVPQPQRYLHYRGDVTTSQWLGRRVGPNTFGEVLFVVDWSYDETYTPTDEDSDRRTGKTTVGLAYIDPTPERSRPSAV